MRPLARWTAALALFALCGAVGLIVLAAQWLRPVPASVGEVTLAPPVEGPAATCEAPGRPPLQVTSTLLLSCPEVFDAKTVQVSGEAIGDLLGQGPRHWILLNDDVYAWEGPLDSHHRTGGTNTGIAVLLPAGTRPEHLGGPGITGDRLRVTGQFEVAAEEDQGGTAVIAERVELIAPGGPVESIPATRQRVVAVPMLLVAGALTLIAQARGRDATWWARLGGPSHAERNP